MANQQKALFAAAHVTTAKRGPIGKLHCHEAEAVLFRDLLIERTGLLMDGPREQALHRAILKAADEAGCRTHMDYYELLRGTETESEIWDDLIKETTVSETYLFRNTAHINALRNHILPHIIQKHRDTRQIRIWSAGCSSGEEPYTLAILLSELIPDIESWQVCILGTDINRQVLHRARKAEYRSTSFRKATKEQQDRSFSHHDDMWTVRPHIRELVTFEYLNLAEPLYPSLLTGTTALDLILCRNVAIYLPEAVIRNKADRFHKCLMVDGWLLMGASETNAEIYTRFETVNFEGCTAYQKIPESALARHPRIAARRTAPTRVRPTCKPDRRAAAKKTSRTPSPRPVKPGPQEARQEPVPAPMKPAETTGSRYEQAMARMEQGLYDDAIPLFQQHMKHESADESVCCCQVAISHANMGRLRDAETACEQAIDHDSLMLEPYYTLALIFEEEAEWHKAVEQLKKTLYLDPDFLMGHYRLASNYLQLAQPDDAERHRTHAVRLSSALKQDEVIPLSDGITAAHVLAMVQSL